MTLRAVSPSGTGGGGTPVPSGGTTGQVLGNTSGTPAWTTPSTPYLHATLSTNLPLTSGVASIVTFDTIVSDTNGYFNPTTHVYTPLIPGRYLVIVSILGSYTLSVSGTIESAVRKNGVQYAVCRSSLAVAGPLNAAQQCTAVVAMNGTTDTISAQASITGTSPAVTNGVTGTYFQIIYLGP